MRKLWLPCVLWFLPLLGLGVGAAFSREVAPTSGADASRILASSAYVASDAATPGIDCRLPAVPRANRSALAGVVQASGAAPCGDSGTGAEVAAYVRLHRQARTDIPFEWRRFGDCVLPWEWSRLHSLTAACSACVRQRTETRLRNPDNDVSIPAKSVSLPGFIGGILVPADYHPRGPCFWCAGACACLTRG